MDTLISLTIDRSLIDDVAPARPMCDRYRRSADVFTIENCTRTGVQANVVNGRDHWVTTPKFGPFYHSQRWRFAP